MDPLALRAAVHELAERVKGRTVRRAGLIHPDELGLWLDAPGDKDILVLAAWPGAPHVRLDRGARFDRRLTDQLANAPDLLAGSQIIHIDTTGFERVLHIGLQPFTSDPPARTVDIFFELVSRTPFVVVTADEVIVAAVRAPGTRRPDERAMERGAPYHLPFRLGPPAGMPDARTALTALLEGDLPGAETPGSAGDRPPATRSAPTHPTEAPIWVEQVARKLRGVPRERLAAFLAGARDASQAAERLASFRGPLAIETGPGQPPILVPVAHSPGRSADPGQPAGESPLAVIALWARRRMEHERTVRLAAAIGAALRAEKKRIERTRERLTGDVSGLGNPAELRRRAEALLANLHRVAHGTRRVQVPDPYGGEAPIVIELDPRRSPAGNAEAFFQAARKAERAREHLEARRRTQDERARVLAEAESRLERESSEPAGLIECARELIAAGIARGDLERIVGAWTADEESPGRGTRTSGPTPAGVRAKGKATPVRVPYRAYALDAGWEMWIGRSAADNDVLTHKLARPHDVWMHAHGAAGSHVVLRRTDGARIVPPRAIIEAAASAAAFYSQARHSRLVPVIVTEKRYVRKPRGSPPGTASCLREKTVMAAPRRPSGAQAEEGEEDKGSRSRPAKPKRGERG
jgi:predicted ribosome quality control (RQC) complex YloA/Tae2 family protein